MSPPNPPHQAFGARMTSYFSSSVAFSSPSNGTKFTTKSSLTANTVSVVKYGSSDGKICVVTGIYESCEIYKVSLAPIKRRRRKLTIKWMCAGLNGCLSSRFNNTPAGPSVGSEYAVGFRQ